MNETWKEVIDMLDEHIKMYSGMRIEEGLKTTDGRYRTLIAQETAIRYFKHAVYSRHAKKKILKRIRCRQLMILFQRLGK